MTYATHGVSVGLTASCTCDAHPLLRAGGANPDTLPSELHCSACGIVKPLHKERLSAGGGLTGCLLCAHPELYTRKSFPPSIGIAIVIVAAVLAPWTHYLSLVVAAVIDFALYRLTSDVVVCYVCSSEHRGFSPAPRHPRFDREIAERLRFGTRAVMGKPMREAGTADAPEPEH